MISLSVTEASRHFLDLVHQVCAREEEALLNEDGRPVVRLVPVTTRAATGERLSAAWRRMERLGADEAESLEHDLAAARSGLKTPVTSWD